MNRWCSCLFVALQASLTRTGVIGIYQHMENVGICTRLAAFYVDYAERMEECGDEKNAREILERGTDMRAQPEQLLRQRKECVSLLNCPEMTLVFLLAVSSN